MKRSAIVFLVIAALLSPNQERVNAQAKADSSSKLQTDSTRYGMVYISHIALDFVSVLDPETNKVVRKIKSGMGPCCVELSPQLDHGYIADFMTNELAVFNTKTDEGITVVSAGDHPSDIVLTADARYLLIGHESHDGLWFLDTHTNEVVKKLNEGTGILCRDDRGKKIYQSQIFIPYVFVIDPEKQAIEKRIYVGGRPLDLALSPDGKSLYVANYDLNEVEQIDTKSDTVVARIPGVNTARGIAVTNDGKYAYVTNVKPSTMTVIDLGSNAVVKTIPVGAMPTSIAIRPDGTYAYVSCQGSAALFVIDTKTQEIAHSIVVESNPIRVQVK